jgi:uncharacterized membrane protein
VVYNQRLPRPLWLDFPNSIWWWLQTVESVTVFTVRFGIKYNLKNSPVSPCSRVLLELRASQEIPHNMAFSSLLSLTLTLLTWRIWWASNNASRWQIGFNSAFEELKKTAGLTLVNFQLDAQNSYLFTYNTFIKILYMFRALPCSSSGGLRCNCIYAASGIVTVCRWLTVFFLNRCTGQSPADSDDTRGCI